MEPSRIEYDVNGLLESDVAANPTDQFARWFSDAVSAALPEANMMVLATADETGSPDARVVLLKGHDERGFVFYTNYDSAKGRQLGVRPEAVLVFHWQPLHRQVRIHGKVAPVTAAESDVYFATRPRGSQLAARASHQSGRVVGRKELHDRYVAEETEWKGRDVPRPSGWGGYRLDPFRFEFWQGQSNRLHDRVGYERVADEWRLFRLDP